MSADYEICESVWQDQTKRDKYIREVIHAGYSLGICDDKTGECMYVIPGRVES